MAAPLVDKRSPAQLAAWVEMLARADRVVPGPDLVGAVVTGPVVHPDTIDQVLVAAGTTIDAPTAAMVARHRWLVVRDLLEGSVLGRGIANPATGTVIPEGTEVDAALAQVIDDLARVVGPEVLVGCHLGQPLVDTDRSAGDQRELPAGTLVTAALAAQIDRRTWVRVASWQPRPDGRPDPGRALIGIFGRFASMVVDRINRAPEKHELAFLNLTGLQPLPPRPARVPLTFALATGSPVDGVIPPGTQVAAPPLEGEDSEVVFETERGLVVTRSQLTAVVVGDPGNDSYADRTAQATGALDEAWDPFTGHEPVPRELYLACEPVLSPAGPKEVVVRLESDNSIAWDNWPLSWSAWDPQADDGAGGKGAWKDQGYANPFALGGTGFQWELLGVPDQVPTTVGGRQARWLRARLDTPLPPTRTGVAPDSIAVGARAPRDLELPLEPFGGPDTGGAQAKWFYTSVDDAIGVGMAKLTFEVRLDRPGVGPDVRIDWTYKVGSEWVPLGQSVTTADRVWEAQHHGFLDGTRAFTEDGPISFGVPDEWPRELFRSRIGRWLRAEVVSAGAGYATPPRISFLDVTYARQLPTIRSATIQLRRAPRARPAPAAAFGSVPIDLSKDFYPFGEEPRFNDTFHVAIPDAMVRPGELLWLTFELTNPPGTVTPRAVHTEGKAKIAWEVWDGTAWTPVTPVQTTGTDFTSATSFVVVKLPPKLERVTVAGEERYWMRARLISGHYGVPATYEPVTTGSPTGSPTAAATSTSYRLVPATLAPPVIKKMELKGDTPGAAVPATACITRNDFTEVDQSEVIAGGGGAFTPFTSSVEQDPAFYLGFDQPFDNTPVALYLQVEPPQPEEVAADQLAEIDPSTLAQLEWEYSGPDGWRSLGAVDETRSLGGSGLVGFVGPRDITARSVFGQERYWVRARWSRGYFRLPPRLRRIVANTTWAAQVTGVTGEVLGSANGDPGQVFATAQTPVQPGQRLSVREPDVPPASEQAVLAAEEGPGAVEVTLDAAGHADEVWVRWHAVDDFYASGPRDRHYTLDPLTGEVRFGDGQHGMVPLAGQGNLRISYGSGGGEQGNRAAGTIVGLKTAVPYVDSVTNLEPSSGGAPREPLDRLRERGPRSLRHRGRAVTAQDLEDLARSASTDVARAVAIGPAFSPTDLWIDRSQPSAGLRSAHTDANAGRMGVVVVPDSAGARPTPTLGLLNQVEAYLLQRCPPTADLWVAGPEWVQVTVTTRVVVTSLDVAGAVGARVTAALDRFLHPLTGGLGGGGWAFGRKPHRSDLFALVEAVDGVDHVPSLTVDHLPETTDAIRQVALQRALAQTLAEASEHPPEPDIRRWLARALVCSGPHQVTVALDR